MLSSTCPRTAYVGTPTAWRAHTQHPVSDRRAGVEDMSVTRKRAWKALIVLGRTTSLQPCLSASIQTVYRHTVASDSLCSNCASPVRRLSSTRSPLCQDPFATLAGLSSVVSRTDDARCPPREATLACTMHHPCHAHHVDVAPCFSIWQFGSCLAKDRCLCQLASSGRDVGGAASGAAVEQPKWKHSRSIRRSHHQGGGAGGGQRGG